MRPYVLNEPGRIAHVLDHVGEDAHIEGLLGEGISRDGADAHDLFPELVIGDARGIGGVFQPVDLIAPVAGFKQHVPVSASHLQQ